jgi:hypothetical protein
VAEKKEWASIPAPLQRRTSMQRQVKADRQALPCAGWHVCLMHGARGGAPEVKRNGNYRHGALTRETIEAVRYVNALALLTRRSDGAI